MGSTAWTAGGWVLALTGHLHPGLSVLQLHSNSFDTRLASAHSEEIHL